MQVRRSERMKLIEDFYPSLDSPIRPDTEIESMGSSDCDLCCGQDGTVLLRNFTVEEAQDLFGRPLSRTVIKCPTCNLYNLVAAAVEKGEDGRIVTLPRGK